MEPINLLIAINKSYMEQCKTMLFSLFENIKSREIRVFLMTNSLSKHEIIVLYNYINKLGGSMEYIESNKKIFNDLPVTERFSVEMYYRIFSFYFLPANINRVLWLDSDLIVTKNIEKFYDQNFDNKDIVACEDFESHSSEICKIKKNMDISNDHVYFNSGVILFNLEKIRTEFSLDNICEIIDQYKNLLVYPDQDLLNKLYQGKIKYANSKKYNFQVNLTSNISLKENEIYILHYSGNKKPWVPRYARPICKYYWYYQWKQRNCLEFFKFYILYVLLYIPKIIKRKIDPGY